MTPTPLTVLTEEEIMFRDAVGRMAREMIAPMVTEMDEKQRFDESLVPMLFEMGVMGIEVPVELGGAGASFFMACLAVEEFSSVDPSVGVLVDVQNTLVINAFRRWANDEQKATYLRRLAKDTVGAYALSEPASGSDAFALRTRATVDGDDYLLNGNKLWITNAKEADVFIVFATVDPDAGYKGITAFIVDKGLPGFSIGKKESKLGIRASSTCELVFENVRVPKANVLGEVGRGYKVAIETLNEGRIGIGAQMIGLARGALSNAIDYVKERKQFGRPVASFQGLQFQIAQCATEIEAAKLMVYNAARLKDAGKPFVRQAAMAKLFSSQVAERVASLSVEFHGGVGFTTEFPAEKFYRDAKIGKIYEGTSNMQLQTIAKMVLADGL